MHVIKRIQSLKLAHLAILLRRLAILLRRLAILLRRLAIKIMNPNTNMRQSEAQKPATTVDKNTC
jgi:hypothetical protein